MRELNYGECVVLGKITSSKKAWVELDELAEDGDSVTSLVLEGLVEIWPAGEQGRGVNHPPIVTLTPLGAEILGVTLIERIETLPPQCPPATAKGGGSRPQEKEERGSLSLLKSDAAVGSNQSGDPSWHSRTTLRDPARPSFPGLDGHSHVASGPSGRA